MRYVLLIFAFNGLFAQDLNFASRLNAIGTGQVKVTADEITQSLKGEFRPIAAIEKDNTYYVLIYPESISDESAKADVTQWKTNCQKCYKIEFSVYENQDGKTYYFKELVGQYDVLFPWWKKHFAPDETSESLKDSKKRYVKNFNPDIDIRFVEDQGDWVIRNVH